MQQPQASADANTLLEIKSLSVVFRQANQCVEAVKNANLSVKKGEIFALVGESGSGKSVTAASILQLLPYPIAQHPSGSIRLEGKELLGADAKTLQAIRGKEIGMIFQEPMLALNPLQTLEKQISEMLMLHQGLSKSKAQERSLELLNLVKLPQASEKLKAYPNALSGGQRQRVMIAMALANNPKLLIADEPTTALDVTLQLEILSLIQSLQTQLGMSVLLITHDLNLVRRYADRVAVMAHGEVLETARTTDLFDHTQHPYTKALLSAKPKGGPITRPKEAAAPLLEVQNLKVWFPKTRGILNRVYDHFKAVDGISLQIQTKETLGVVGESGSGKSTLGLAITRLIRSQGSIRFDQQRIDQMNQKKIRPLRSKIQIVFQDPFASLSPRLLVNQIISEGLKIHQPDLSTEALDEAVVQALKDVELDPELRHRYPHEFSGGQRQRIAIARALILKPKLIILDEPTSALDRAIQIQITDLLKRLQNQFDLSYLFISHDLSVVKSISHKVLVMKDGVVIESGSSEAIFNAPEHQYTKQLLEAAL